jgi:dTDP-4-dehydrorhamnose 3,5-epimerase
MKRTPTSLPGVYLIEPERLADERGFFARTFCTEEFSAWGLDPRVAQCSVSFNPKPGTLRGLHYQAPPHAECKLVRCTRGAIYDVAVDLRRDSPMFRRWFAAELSCENRLAMYIPDGVAHGFQTLAVSTEVLYQISGTHVPDSARGVRWDDPAFGIDWPSAVERLISPRDRTYPDFGG